MMKIINIIPNTLKIEINSIKRRRAYSQMVEIINGRTEYQNYSYLKQKTLYVWSCDDFNEFFGNRKEQYIKRRTIT